MNTPELPALPEFDKQFQHFEWVLREYASGNASRDSLDEARHNVHEAVRAALAAQPAECGNTPYDEGPFTLSAQQAPVAPELDVRRILLDIVPGEDGLGHEVYAKTVADVEARMHQMGERIEELEARRQAPVARVQVMGSYKGVPGYGCLLPLDSQLRPGDPLYAAPSAPSDALPDDAPTKAMIEAGVKAAHANEAMLYGHEVASIYRAMRAVAPSAPAALPDMGAPASVATDAYETHLDQIDAEKAARDWLNAMIPKDRHRAFWQWETFSFSPHDGRVHLLRSHEKPVAAALIVRDGLNRSQVLRWVAHSRPEGNAALLRQAGEALEAHERWHKHHDDYIGSELNTQAEAALNAIRAHLAGAQPVVLSDEEIAAINREAQDQALTGIAPSQYVARAAIAAHCAANGYPAPGESA